MIRYLILRICLLCELMAATLFSQRLSGTDWSAPYKLSVFPPEHRLTSDPESGAELNFITSNPAPDINLYYHQRSWLANSAAILFYSQREAGGLMSYRVETGEIVRITGPDGGACTGATAAIHRNTIFAVWKKQAVEIEPNIEPATCPGKTSAQARIRILGELGPTTLNYYELNESCDGQYLAYGMMGFGENGGPVIALIDVETGTQRALVALPPDRGPVHHVQWSRSNPYLLSFSSLMEPYKLRAGPLLPSNGPTDYPNRCQRLWVIDMREGVPRNVYQAVEHELVTHAVWWIDDTILFTGAIQAPVETEWSHVKVLDVRRGDVRILGAGSWWPKATPEEMSHLNWWHPAGSEDGHWVVADNWHGDIMLFEGRTARPHRLTQNHRTYGHGDHPHPGWDRKGNQVIFTSHQQGSADVCVASLPPAWQEHVRSNTDGLGDPIMHHKIMPQGQMLLKENFENLDRWHIEGHTNGVSLAGEGGLRLDCTGSVQGGVGVHAFLKDDLPDQICVEYDLFTEQKNGLLITFLGMQGINGEDAISGVPPRAGKFIDYTGEAATTRSYHLSLSRFDDQGVHTGVSNWRRNPGLHLVGQGPDPCAEIGKVYHVAIIKQGRRCQLQVDGNLISGFIDTAPDDAVPGAGKIGFRVIGARAVVRIANLQVTALE